MPIFEYVCRDCNKSFEALVYGEKTAECPECHGRQLDQHFSVFSAQNKASGWRSETRKGPSCDAPGGCCGGGMCEN